MFWIIIALLSAIATLYLIAPLAQKKPPQILSHDAALKRHYYKQLKQIERNLAQNDIDAELATLQKVQIARQLQKLDSEDTQNSTKDLSKIGQYCLMIGIPVLSLGLYFTIGAPNYDVTEQIGQKVPKDVQQQINQLRADLELNPNDLQALVILAEFEKQQGNGPQAEQYLTQAFQLNPQSAPLLSALLELKILNNQGRVSERLKTELLKLYQLDSQNHLAYFYLGEYASQRGDFVSAEQIWRDLLSLSTPQDPWFQTVKRRISDLYQLTNISQEDAKEINQMVNNLKSRFNLHQASLAEWQLLTTSLLRLDQFEDLRQLLDQAKFSTFQTTEDKNFLFQIFDQHIPEKDWFQYPLYLDLLRWLETQPAALTPTQKYHLGAAAIRQMKPQNHWNAELISALKNPLRQEKVKRSIE